MKKNWCRFRSMRVPLVGDLCPLCRLSSNCIAGLHPIHRALSASNFTGQPMIPIVGITPVLPAVPKWMDAYSATWYRLRQYLKVAGVPAVSRPAKGRLWHIVQFTGQSTLYVRMPPAGRPTYLRVPLCGCRTTLLATVLRIDTRCSITASTAYREGWPSRTIKVRVKQIEACSCAAGISQFTRRGLSTLGEDCWQAVANKPNLDSAGARRAIRPAANGCAAFPPCVL